MQSRPGGKPWARALIKNKISWASKGSNLLIWCPGLNANEIQIPYDKHHKVSSLVKRHQNAHNSVKYEVLTEEYLHKCWFGV